MIQKLDFVLSVQAAMINDRVFIAQDDLVECLKFFASKLENTDVRVTFEQVTATIEALKSNATARFQTMAIKVKG